MANIKAAIKSIRQTKRRAARNSSVKAEVKTAFRKAVAAITEKSKDAQALVMKAISVIDKASENGIIHKNSSARKKSRLMKKFNLAFKK